MPKIRFANADESAASAFPDIQGVVARGAMESRGIFAGEDRPLHLWRHDLVAGACIELQQPPGGHAFFVLSGAIDCNDGDLTQGGAVVAEHRCTAALRARPGGASLLHFHARSAPKGDGGHLHAAGPDGRLRIGNIPGTHLEEGHFFRGTLWSELDCPTCELWLYRSDLGGAIPQKGTLHFHSTDEVIYILRGEMLIGTRSFTSGAAMAIDAKARYRMGVGDPGVSFLNFRARNSSVVMLEQGNAVPTDERESWRRGR